MKLFTKKSIRKVKKQIKPIFVLPATLDEPTKTDN